MRRCAAAGTAASSAPSPIPPGYDEISRLAVTLNEMLERLLASFPRTAGELEAAVCSAAEETERLSRSPTTCSSPAPGRERFLCAWPAPTRTNCSARPPHGSAHGRPSSDARSRSSRRRSSSWATATGSSRRSRASLRTAVAHGPGEIRLAASKHDVIVELHVRDEGAGFPTSFLARAFDGFSRADDAGGRGGSGLGLSIVGLIAEAHGGRTAALNRPSDGADVWLELPLEGTAERPETRQESAHRRLIWARHSEDVAKRKHRTEPDERAELRRALAMRDRAHQRLRGATGGAVAMALALSGIFAVLAAGSTYPKKKVVVTRAAAPRRRSRVAPLPVAPAAPLVAAHQAASAPAAPSSSAPAASAAVPSSAPAVVVSGGS